MSYDPDLIDEYRKPEYHGERISDEEAGDRYEADDAFMSDVINTLCGADAETLPETLRDALASWYRTTSDYDDAVRAVRDAAERPY
jgi:DNA phosphorothioation-dependent restriction protein DptG